MGEFRRGDKMPASMMDPTVLDPDDSWTWTCGTCHAYIQGGRPGLDAHIGTVHGGE